MTSLHPDTFNKKAEPPILMTPKEYQAILETLLAKGTGWGKTKNVGGYLLDDIVIETETSSGKTETVKKVTVEKVAVIMDIEQYPLEKTRDLVIQEIAANWGKKVIKQRNPNEPEFRGPGLWTIKAGAFKDDYVAVNGSNTYEPNTAAWRVTVETDKAVKIPVQWGDFVVEKGGALAIRQKDVPALAEALQAVRSGTTTAEEALYTQDKDGKTVAKFDVYGMEPNFLPKNYNPVELYPETEKAMAAFGAKPAAPKKPGNGLAA